MSVKSITSEINRVKGREYDQDEMKVLVKCIQKLGYAGSQLLDGEKEVLTEFVENSRCFTRGGNSLLSPLVYHKGELVKGLVAEAVRWVKERVAPDERLWILEALTEELTELGFSRSSTEDLLEGLLVSYEYKDINYLSDAQVEAFFDWDWTCELIPFSKDCMLRTKKGKALPQALAWCLEKTIVRKVLTL